MSEKLQEAYIKQLRESESSYKIYQYVASLYIDYLVQGITDKSKLKENILNNISEDRKKEAEQNIDLWFSFDDKPLSDEIKREISTNELECSDSYSMGDEDIIPVVEYLAERGEQFSIPKALEYQKSISEDGSYALTESDDEESYDERLVKKCREADQDFFNIYALINNRMKEPDDTVSLGTGPYGQNIFSIQLNMHRGDNNLYGYIYSDKTCKVTTSSGPNILDPEFIDICTRISGLLQGYKFLHY